MEDDVFIGGVDEMALGKLKMRVEGRRTSV
jgi:hypothetical protein